MPKAFTVSIVVIKDSLIITFIAIKISRKALNVHHFLNELNLKLDYNL